MKLWIPKYVHGSDSSCVYVGVQGGIRVGSDYVHSQVWVIVCKLDLEFDNHPILGSCTTMVS